MIGKMSIFELIMMVMFGTAWPFNLIRQLRKKTSRGISTPFYLVIIGAYISGIVNKLVNGIDYVIVVYCINFGMVTMSFILMLIYRRRDRNTCKTGEPD